MELLCKHALKVCKYIQQELQYTILAAIEHVKQLKQYDTWDVEEMKTKIEELEAVINSNTEEVNTLEKDIPKLEEIISETKLLNNVRKLPILHLSFNPNRYAHVEFDKMDSNYRECKQLTWRCKQT